MNLFSFNIIINIAKILNLIVAIEINMRSSLINLHFREVSSMGINLKYYKILNYSTDIK